MWPCFRFIAQVTTIAVGLSSRPSLVEIQPERKPMLKNSRSYLFFSSICPCFVLVFVFCVCWFYCVCSAWSTPSFPSHSHSRAVLAVAQRPCGPWILPRPKVWFQHLTWLTWLVQLQTQCPLCQFQVISIQCLGRNIKSNQVLCLRSFPSGGPAVRRSPRSPLPWPWSARCTRSNSTTSWHSSETEWGERNFGGSNDVSTLTLLDDSCFSNYSYFDLRLDRLTLMYLDLFPHLEIAI